MDILSDTLRVVRMTGAVFFRADLGSPWAFHSPPADELRSHLRSDSECLTLFHIVDRGQCWITIDGVVSFMLREGDAVVFPHGSAHVMSSLREPPESEIHTIPIEALVRDSREGVASVSFGGQGDQTRMVCGYLQCDQKFNPLVGALPAVLWLRPGGHEDSPLHVQDRRFAPWCVVRLDKGQWLETTLRHTMEEVKRGGPGNAAMLSRLSEIMYVEVLRRYMQQLPGEVEGWLAAVRDRSVGKVLELMHAWPDRAWTVEELASAAAVSRSSLAQRFAALLGETPMQYLAAWRMQVAKYLLRQTNLTIADIASRTGYASEVAFNHAFKRYVGDPPVAWRNAEVRGAAGDRPEGIRSAAAPVSAVPPH